MRAAEMLLLVLGIVIFMWVIPAHPTPDEQARVYDSMDQSTAITWR